MVTNDVSEKVVHAQLKCDFTIKNTCEKSNQHTKYILSEFNQSICLLSVSTISRAMNGSSIQNYLYQQTQFKQHDWISKHFQLTTFVFQIYRYSKLLIITSRQRATSMDCIANEHSCGYNQTITVQLPLLSSEPILQLSILFQSILVLVTGS